jgi:hypothetical protein
MLLDWPVAFHVLERVWRKATYTNGKEGLAPSTCAEPAVRVPSRSIQLEKL